MLVLQSSYTVYMLKDTDIYVKKKKKEAEKKNANAPQGLKRREGMMGQPEREEGMARYPLQECSRRKLFTVLMGVYINITNRRPGL